MLAGPQERPRRLRSPPAPPGPRLRPRDHVDPFAHGPQVDHVRGNARKTIVVAADATVLVAFDATGERHLAVLLEQGRIVEAGAAGDETPADLVAAPVRTAAG